MKGLIEFAPLLIAGAVFAAISLTTILNAVRAEFAARPGIGTSQPKVPSPAERAPRAATATSPTSPYWTLTWHGS